MKRREFLRNLRNFCALYGISGILTDYALGATTGAPQRFVSFVIKYTGGATEKDGVGNWVTSAGGVLSPLASCASDLAIPLGLDSQFNAPMNSHASPQVSALSGAMTGFVMHETQYPTGNLKNYSTGDGKSIDVLIGEKLQSTYKTKLPYLFMGNNESYQLACTHKTSSWGYGGSLIEGYYSPNGLAREIASHTACQEHSKQTYSNRLKAIEYIRQNNTIFGSRYLVDHGKLENLQQKLAKNVSKYKADIQNIDSNGATPCSSLADLPEMTGSYADRAIFNSKMASMYDLGVTALRNNVTRVLTYNLYVHETHSTSHFLQPDGSNTIAAYHNIGRFLQSSIASFIAKLKAQNLYDNTIIFCNAGSCSSGNVHNYENLSTYVINAGVSGVRGAVNVPLPVGSLHVELLRKFGIPYATYGGTDHIYGVGKPAGLLG